MKILVTGASGFVGRNLVARLLGEGHEVRAVYRRSKLPPQLEALAHGHAGALELVRAELSFERSLPDSSDPFLRAWARSARRCVPAAAFAWPVDHEDLAAAGRLMAGVDACIHIAARVGDWGTPKEWFMSNVNPTRVLLEAARHAGLKRFVYCSSVAVHGFRHHRGSTEDGPYYRVGNGYCVSKRLSESLVNDEIGRGLDAVIVRPGQVYGPGDTTVFYPIFDQGMMPLLGGGRRLTCPVYIDDLVGGLEAALTVAHPVRRRYNLTSGERVTWRELADLVQDSFGGRFGRLSLPTPLIYFLAPLFEATGRLLRFKERPLLTWYTATQLLHDYHFSVDAARSELGYHPRVLAPEGIRRTVEAYRSDRQAI
jgi:nucleoside-diphosphate-sugar epimerase